VPARLPAHVLLLPRWWQLINTLASGWLYCHGRCIAIKKVRRSVHDTRAPDHWMPCHLGRHKGLPMSALRPVSGVDNKRQRHTLFPL
jgi:hypothetical protein